MDRSYRSKFADKTGDAGSGHQQSGLVVRICRSRRREATSDLESTGCHTKEPVPDMER